MSLFKVSVIITCFNQESYINEAINSIYNQTFSDWECIIIDDGSTDQSAIICQNWVKKDSRIKYFYQSNQGVSVARNNGFKYSSGEFIQFLDGDDYLLQTKLEVQVNHIDMCNKICICFTNHYHFWNKEKRLASYNFDILDYFPLNQFLFKHDNGISIPLHSALIPRSIWQNDELPFASDFSYRYEDWIFWIRICLKNIPFHFIDQRLAVYRMHELNFISDPLTVATNSLKATFYISKIIPENIRNQFIDNKITFILDRFRISVLNGNNDAFRFKNIIKNQIKKYIKI